MSQINPFIGSILQATDVQRQQADTKDRRLRRVADLAKDSALVDDQLEHQVESSDAVAPVHADGEHPEHTRKKPRKHPDDSDHDDADDSPPHLDLTA